tara:strand:+ start:726 stop:1103 length:378 start_codon:yes stop_codon:yes gene_type:complete
MQEDWKNWKNDNTRRLYTIYGDLLNTHAWSQTQRYPIGKDRSIFSRMLTFAVKELADKYENKDNGSINFRKFKANLHIIHADLINTIGGSRRYSRRYTPREGFMFSRMLTYAVKELADKYGSDYY